MVHHFVHFVEFQLAAQEIIFNVVLEVLLVQVRLQVLVDDSVYFLEDLQHLTD